MNQAKVQREIEETNSGSKSEIFQALWIVFATFRVASGIKFLKNFIFQTV